MDFLAHCCAKQFRRWRAGNSTSLYKRPFSPVHPIYAKSNLLAEPITKPNSTVQPAVTFHCNEAVVLHFFQLRSKFIEWSRTTVYFEESVLLVAVPFHDKYLEWVLVTQKNFIRNCIRLVRLNVLAEWGNVLFERFEMLGCCECQGDEETKRRLRSGRGWRWRHKYKPQAYSYRQSDKQRINEEIITTTPRLPSMQLYSYRQSDKRTTPSRLHNKELYACQLLGQVYHDTIIRALNTYS